jgi:putative tryptophan/tyrosine transport system substrate-binding protein
MRRREFITLLGGAAAWPAVSRAQEVEPRARSADRPARIAHVNFISAAVAQPYVRAFRNGLRALGWIEGRNVTIEDRFAEGEDDRLPAIVDEILAMKPDVIVIGGARVVHAFRERTAATPIVTAVIADPVGSGLIASFARPGGNVTGLAFQDAELVTKRAELLKELVPGLARIALLNDPALARAHLTASPLPPSRRCARSARAAHARREAYSRPRVRARCGTRARRPGGAASIVALL